MPTREQLIKEAISLAGQMPRGDLQGWLEAQCLLNPELDEDEILRSVDELILMMI